METDLILKIRGDMTDLLKQIKSVTGEKIKLGVDSIKGGAGLTSPIGGKETGGILKSAMGGAMMPMLKALAPLAILGTILTSSKAMMASLKQVFKVIQLIVKPIGDIMSVGLMPIIQILKPIGRLVNSLMRPYLMKAREAMRIGGKFMKEGEYGDAAKAYILGFSYMIKPFFDLMIKANAEIAKTPLRIMKLFGEGLIALGERIPIVGDAFKWMGATLSDASDNMMSQVDNAAEAIISFTNDALDNTLGSMLIKLGIKTGETTGDVIKKFERMGINTSAIVYGMEFQFSEFRKQGLIQIEGFTGGAIEYLEHLRKQAENLKKSAPSRAPEISKYYSEKMGKTQGDIQKEWERGYSYVGVSNKRQLEAIIGSIGNRDWREMAKKAGIPISSHQMGTPYIPETGLYTLHRGERVLSANENARGGGGNTYNISLPSINVNISEVRNDRDISDIASQLSEEILSNIRNRVGS